METMSKKKSAWIGGDKGSLDPSKQRTGFSLMESPLATQLQHAWLQTQLPKRNVPKLDFLSPLPSPDYLIRSSSSAFSQRSQPISPESYSDVPTSHSEVGSISSHGGTADNSDFGSDYDAMEDEHMLQYLSDMLMEEDMTEKKCMYVQCSAYQAMTKELADLIGDPGPTDDLYVGCHEGERGSAATNSWIDEVLCSDPQDDYLREDEGAALSAELETLTTVTLESDTIVRLGDECPFIDAELAVEGIDFSNGRSTIESLVELYPLLMQCAQAVAADDVRGANQLINELRQKSSPYGDGGQRMTYYFVEALVARLSGTGAQLYTAMSSNRPSAVEMLKAYRLYVQRNPLPRLSHFFANATIFKAITGVERVHIIDFGILYGLQWPCFLHKLAQRPGGPPHVRLTGIDFPQPGFHKNERVEETGRRLAAIAKQLGIEFEYHAIACKWETIQVSQLILRQDEMLIVNSIFRLRNLLDETVMASNPRKMVLAKIRSLNPKLFVMGVVSAGYNTPFFMARFRETFNHYSALFDSIHSSVPPDVDLRRLVEKEILGREILNIIACEGPERIERAETYRQWQSRTLNAGFKQEPLDLEIYGHAQEILKRYHRNYGIGQDGNWTLGGWGDRVLHGMSAWRPA